MLNSFLYVAEKEEEEHFRVNCLLSEGSVLSDTFIKLFSSSKKELKRHGAVKGLLSRNKKDECGAGIYEGQS